MEIKAQPFDHLPFSALFNHLIQYQKEAIALFQYPVFDADRAIKEHSFAGDRSYLAHLIARFNASFELTTEVKQNIERLSLPQSVCVVTGQQLSVLGGPVFTLYKIVSAIAMARRLERAHQRPVIPVFWLADEDHDIDEIVDVHLLQKGDIRTHTYPDPYTHPLPIADRRLSESIKVLLNEVFDHLESTPYTEQLRAQLDRAYQPGLTHRQAFGSLIMQWFGKYGLVLLGSNDVELKTWLKPTLKQAISKVDAVYEALRNQTQKLETSYKKQAQISASLLFFLNPESEKARYRIKHENGVWSTEFGHRWTTPELLNHIDRNPEHFSPTVFLRPILQDGLIPTLAYVAGPGELAYYAQMHELYQVFGLKMPLITPRHSVTMLDPAIARNLQQLSFSFSAYYQRIEDLEKDYITQHQTIDSDKWAATWIELIRSASESAIAALTASDPTLKASAERTLSETEASIMKLKQKWIKSLKEKEQTAIQRIHRVKNACFPNQEPQERVISSIYFINKYGLGLLDELLSIFEEYKADHHYLLMP